MKLNLGLAGLIAWVLVATAGAGCRLGFYRAACGGDGECADAGRDAGGGDGDTPVENGDDASADGGGDGDTPPLCDNPRDALPVWYRGFVPRQELFVAPGGNDEASGTSPVDPLATLGEAFSRLEPGTRVNLAAGHYACESLSDFYASADAPVVIRSADGPRQAVLDCGGGDGLCLFKVRYLALEGLEVSNTAGHGIHLNSSSPVDPDDLSSDILLLDLFIHDTGEASFKASQASRVSVIGCELARATTGWSMLVFVAVDEVIIAGCEGYASDAFNKITGQGGLVFGNYVHDTTGGIHVGADCTDSAALTHPQAGFEARDLKVYNNRIVNVEDGGFRIVSCHDCWVVNNTYTSSSPSAALRIIASAFDCGEAGAVPTSNQGLRIHNNIFAFDSPPGWMIPSNQPDAQPAMTHNAWWSSSGADLQAIGSDIPFAGETHSTYGVDPVFTAPPGDLHLSADSPLRGAGLPIDWLRGNADWECRDSPPDVGAY